MDALKAGTDVFFLLMGAVMVVAMHAGFAFLEVGTVRPKNQVNALIKIFTDFCKRCPATVRNAESSLSSPRKRGPIQR